MFFKRKDNSEEKRLRDLEKSAEAGNVDSQHELGMYYYPKEDSTHIDPIKCVKYLSMAAENGKVNSQFMLGLLYDHEGESYGILGNRDKAVEYYLMAAKNENSDAQYMLARLYLDDMNKDFLYWMCKSYLNGNQDAKELLNSADDDDMIDMIRKQLADIKNGYRL